MPDTSINYKSFIIKAVIICVTIALGVYFGMFIAVKTGLTGSGGQPAVTPDTMRNTTNLEIGDLLPDIAVIDLDSNPVELTALLQGQKTILAFVADGCNPCHDLLADLLTDEAVKSGKRQVLLLSDNAAAYSKTGGFPIYQFSREMLAAFEIQSMPTIIGIDGAKGQNIIKFVTTGYGQEYTFSIIEQYL